jgi:hypothetical protein
VAAQRSRATGAQEVAPVSVGWIDRAGIRPAGKSLAPGTQVRLIVAVGVDGKVAAGLLR